MGTAAIGSGGAAASVDAFGTFVELRSPGPAGKPVIETPFKRQRAGTVAATNGIVVRAAGGEHPTAPLWRAEDVSQHFLAGTNVLVTEAAVAGAEVQITDAIEPGRPAFVRRFDLDAAGGVEPRVRLTVTARFDFGQLPRSIEIEPGAGRFSVQVAEKSVTCRVAPAAAIDHDGDHFTIRWRSGSTLAATLKCGLEGERPPSDANAAITAAVAADREWLSRSRPLGRGAPAWAHRLNRRSLLVLRALTDKTTGAAPAAIRDFWHYIWPRDAAVMALALAESGHGSEARAIARFLSSLDVERAARFTADGLPVEDGREPQGDGGGWLRVARSAGGLPPRERRMDEWRDRGDYAERRNDRGDFLANAIAAGVPAAQIAAEFGHGGVLLRESMRADSALDSAVAWAVKPFPRPTLARQARRAMLRLTEDAGPYGIRPSSEWPNSEPWTAPTAAVAWALAALGERDRALAMAAAVRDSATPLGLLPERVDAADGAPRSTTPLGWSHALAILMLRELWPGDHAGRRR